MFSYLWVGADFRYILCMGKRGSECNFPKLHIFSKILACNTNVYNRTHTGTATLKIIFLDLSFIQCLNLLWWKLWRSLKFIWLSNIYGYWWPSESSSIFGLVHMYVRNNFLSNHNIHKSLCGLCFKALDPLIETFY